MRRLLAVLLLATPMTAQLHAQEASSAEAERLSALLEKHKGDFDYLLGDWRFTAKNSDFGEFAGVWSAVRLSTGSGAHILDEYRITGEARSTSHRAGTLAGAARRADPAVKPRHE